MATLEALRVVIVGSEGDQGIVKDKSYSTGINDRINDAVSAIAGGIRLPNGEMSPPLPDLYSSGTVNTSITLPYVALPATYQRGLFMVSDSSGNQIYGPNGYYSFNLFLRSASDKKLAQAGAISSACVRGSKIYYQGIPSAAETLTLHFYRLPVDMTDNTDKVDGIPLHLQKRLIQHYVAKEIYGEGIEENYNGQATQYHTAKFFEAMNELIDFIGIDAQPEYYGEDYSGDLGVCD